ncbi:MAG TPA: adenylate kinase [Acidimicrobiia bacterium]
MRVLFLGPPGAGKGTQAARVAAHLGIPHISTGDMFRSLDETTELGRRVARIMAVGDYVPDELTISMLRDRLRHPDAERGFILDGFPRTIAQAESLDRALGPKGLDAVVVLEVPEEVLLTRLLGRGRADDTEEAIRTRLRLYAAETEPLVGFYDRRGLVRKIVGVGDIADISSTIIGELST